jgi:hypothetical protein
MSVSYPSSIRLLLYIQSTSSRIPKCFPFTCGTILLSNDDVLPTADASTKCFKENLLPNGALLPNSAHMSVSSLYQFLVLTAARPGASACRVARHVARRVARRRLLRLRRASGCLSTSRGSSPGSSSTTSPAPRVRLLWHVARLVA